MQELQIGTAILKEFNELEKEKAERAARSKVDQKAVQAAIASQVRVFHNCCTYTLEHASRSNWLLWMIGNRNR